MGSLRLRGGIMKNKSKILIHFILIVGSVSMLLPFVWMVLTSLKTFTEATRIPIDIFPEKLMFENYTKALSTLPFVKLFFNTIILVFARVVCAIVFCSTAGYAFARLKFKGKNIMFIIVITQLMLPPQIFIIPQYLMISKWGLTDTIFALIFPGLVSAFGTFFLRQFYMNLPKELEEAAYIDGCSQWKIFLKIMFPLTKTALVALSIFTAIFAWNDLMWPLIVNMSLDKMTLASGLASLQGQYMTDYPVMMAGAFLTVWPMIILYLIFQKHFVEGIALTGTKG